MQRFLIIGGIVAICVGLLWPWLNKLPLGRLPGDLIISRPQIKIYIPVTTMILISLLVSLILWLFRK